MKRHPDMAARLLPDGYVLLHSHRDNRVYTLTPLAGLIWEYCDGRNTIDDIVLSISQIEELAAPSELRSEILTVTEELNKAGLLPQS